MTKANTDIYDNLGEFNAGIEASVSGIRVTQSFANEPFERKQFNYLNQMYRKSKLYFYKVMGVSSAYNYLLIRLINLFSLIFGAYYTIKGEITEGQFVGFILLANIFIRPIEKVNNMIESYPKGFAGFKRFTEEMDKQPSIKDLPGAVAVSHLEGTIAYKDVSFAYEDGTKVLDHINLKIQPGETVAFVGQSGSGKTTLCNLLPRFYEVSSGEITIDGRNIQKMTLASLRKQIGIVQQDVFYSWNITRKYCLWEFKCYRNRHSTSGEISTFRTCNSANARWLGHNYWRTWREIIGRSKAASGNCANVLEEPADFNSR